MMDGLDNELELTCENAQEQVEIFYDRSLSPKIRIKIRDKKTGAIHTRYFEVKK